MAHPARTRPRTKRPAAVVEVDTRWWRRRWFAIGGPVTVLLAGIVVLWVATSGGGAPSAAVRAPEDPKVLAPITPPSSALIEAVGSGGVTSPLVSTGGAGAVLPRTGNMPTVLYVGADYCPYCASERWAVIAALARFGTFQGLSQIRSSSTDTFPNTNTFSFHGATFTSTYVNFQGVELQDGQGNVLDQLNAVQDQAFKKFDVPPYTQNSLAFPFLDIADQYVVTGASYDPGLLKDLSWSAISTLLQTASTPQTQAIIGTSNHLTAAICGATGNQPSSVCGAAAIQSIEAALATTGAATSTLAP